MTLESIEKGVSIWASWVKAHEKLLIIVGGGFLLWHIYGKGVDAWMQHDQRLATAANAQSQVLQTQLAQAQQQNATLIAQINQAMKQRAAQTQQQKKADDNLDATQLAARVQLLLGVGKVTVEPTSSPLSNELVFDETASHKVADDEEDLTQLRADNTDLNTKLTSCQDLNTKSDAALTAEKTAHQDDVKALNLKAKKSWLKGFKWGVITGVVGGLIIHKP